MAGLETEPTTHNNCSREALSGSYSPESGPKSASLQKVDELCFGMYFHQVQIRMHDHTDRWTYRPADATPRKDFRIPDSGLHVNEFGGDWEAFLTPWVGKGRLLRFGVDLAEDCPKFNI